MDGKIKNINDEKNFGFILAEDGEDYFFHRSSLDNDSDWSRLKKNTDVCFEPTNNPKGLRAEGVILI